MRRLKTDNLTVKSGASVISALGKYGSDNISLAFLLRDLGADCARLLIECEAILGIRESVDLAPLKAVEQSGIPYKLSDLAVNGNDLLALGYKGAEIKATLASLQTRVLSGELQNKREYLIDYLKKL
jgi:tRNA nucleotidyltransferase (CCA-adding enzyme)